MNSKPHTHRINILTSNQHHDLAYFKVEYGDTVTHAFRLPPFRTLRVRFAVWRAIHHHDRGSLKAQQIEDVADAYNLRFNEMIVEPSGYHRTKQREEWGTKLMREPLPIQESVPMKVLGP